MKVRFSFLMVLIAFSFAACKKENSSAPVKIYLTDAPAAYEEVNVEITAVRVKMDKEPEEWIDLETKAGVYNLLALQNGVSTVLAEDELPTGVVKEIRLILSNNNTIRVNGQTHPLVIPSGAESGLKIKIDKHLQETLNDITIDFDAGLSVKEEDNGYKLRPVVRMK